MGKKIKFIEEDKMIQLQLNSGFLDNYIHSYDEDHIVGNSADIEQSNKEKSLLLKELGLLNERRKYIIEHLMK